MIIVYYHMYNDFTHPKLLCGLPDGGIVINDIIGDADGSLFNVILQKKSPQSAFCSLCSTLRGITDSYYIPSI